LTRFAPLHSIGGCARQLQAQDLDGKGVTVPERRKYPRYGVQFDAKIESGTEASPALITDISMDGMFLVTDTPLWVGASVTVRVLLHPPLVVDCVVRRVLPGRGMGVQFHRMLDTTRARLERLIVQLGAG
jgi:hypothetical protein